MKHDLVRALLELTLASSGVILVALLIRRPVRRMFGAAAAYFTWLLVPVALIALLLPEAPSVVRAIPVSFGVVQLPILGSAVDASLGTAEHGPGLQSTMDWAGWLLGVWLTVTALCLTYFACAQRAFVRSLGALSDFGTLRKWSDVLRAEHSVGCPALVGVFRPKIILPADFESRYTAREQALVLEHERMHLRRGDAIWNAVAALLRCLFWFNPLVHIAASRLRLDQELACDAAVMRRHPDSLRAYADAMLKTQLADVALPAGCHWRSTHPLKERLMTLKQPAPGRARRAAGAAFITVVSLLVGYTTWAVEPVAVPAPAEIPAPATIAEPASPSKAAAHAVDATTPAPPSSAQPPAALAASGYVSVRADSVTKSGGKQRLVGNVLVKWTNAAREESVITSDSASGLPLGNRPSGGLWTFEGNVHARIDGRSLTTDRLVLNPNGGMVSHGRTTIEQQP
jgi:beta-lactamase regulating signal transducer with metallopeptidase domain